MEKLDQLKKEVNDFKNLLNELRNNVSISEKEKRTKAEALKSQAEATKQKIEREIATLTNKADAISKKGKEKAEALLNSINETLSLYTSILSWSTKPKQTTPTQATTEEKNIFVKAKDWIWDQWDAIWDKGKWERSSEWWKNLLRTAWFVATWVWAVALTYKWLKKLWNWAFSDDEEEEEEETETESKKKKKKKWFWDRWYWKALKWTWIGTWIYYVAHWISTGKWDLSHFFDWKHNWPTSTAEENLDNYTELSHENPEKYREYEQIWENINLMYDKIRETEKNYFWANSQIVMWVIWDKAKEQKIKKDEKFENIETRWLVPYSLDNFYSNVWDIFLCEFRIILNFKYRLSTTKNG